MPGLLWRCGFLISVLLPALAFAAPEKRVALVIGVGHYQTVPALGNPVNDARLIAPALGKLDFDVATVIDPDETWSFRASDR